MLAGKGQTGDDLLQPALRAVVQQQRLETIGLLGGEGIIHDIGRFAVAGDGVGVLGLFSMIRKGSGNLCKQQTAIGQEGFATAGNPQRLISSLGGNIRPEQ